MTDMIEVKTANLIGPALDWAVAQVQIKAGEITPDSEEHSTGRPYFNCKFGNPSLWGEGREQKGTTNKDTGKSWVMHGPGGSYSPSTDWGYGGPLIEKHTLNIRPHCTENGVVTSWAAGMTWPCDTMPSQCGQTALVAACRAIVMKQLGAVVSVPKELMP